MSGIKNWLYDQQLEEPTRKEIELTTEEVLLLFGSLQKVFRSSTGSRNYKKAVENLHSKMFLASMSHKLIRLKPVVPRSSRNINKYYIN